VVLRIPITIHLTALYIWDFGDGKTLVTKLQGAPYPAMINHHTYTSIGEKKVNLSVSWSGVWSAGAISGPINGSITQRLDKEIEILPAKTLFVG
jgi:PKD repeat protein